MRRLARVRDRKKGQRRDQTDSPESVFKLWQGIYPQNGDPKILQPHLRRCISRVLGELLSSHIIYLRLLRKICCNDGWQGSSDQVLLCHMRKDVLETWKAKIYKKKEIKS